MCCLSFYINLPIGGFAAIIISITFYTRPPFKNPTPTATPPPKSVSSRWTFRASFSSSAPCNVYC
jgi:hypothetical protein